MQLVDRIEKRRFVGREFLLWLWFESELFDATFTTREHGEFGLWFEKRLSLSGGSGGKESTRIASVAPGYTQQAKAALLAGQLPDAAGLRIAWRDDETGFLFKAERLSVGGLKIRPPEAAEAESTALADLAPKRKPKKTGKGKRDRDDEAHESFYERMHLTEEFEGLLEALYATFKALRLSEDWERVVLPLLRAWAHGEELEAEAYTALRYPERAQPAASSGETLAL
jgi:hypothetical protein